MTHSTWLYFIGIGNYFSVMIGLHNLINIHYPFKYHTYEDRQKNIIESFNIIITSIASYYFLDTIQYIESNNLDLVTGVTENSVFAIQILSAGLIYETIYYYLILERKDMLILGHHIYTFFSLNLYLYYNILHYYLAMTALVEITNVFLSGMYIIKRNNISNKTLSFVNDSALIITFTWYRILYLPYVFYEYVINYNNIINISLFGFFNGIFIILAVWLMSLFWYSKLLGIYNKKHNILKFE